MFRSIDTKPKEIDDRNTVVFIRSSPSIKAVILKFNCNFTLLASLCLNDAAVHGASQTSESQHRHSPMGVPIDLKKIKIVELLFYTTPALSLDSFGRIMADNNVIEHGRMVS
jgi:hypothetical protein